MSSDKLIELLAMFKHDPLLARLPMPLAVREALGLKPAGACKNVMEASDAYMAASSLPATGVVVDGMVEHTHVVFPVLEPAKPLEPIHEAS